MKERNWVSLVLIALILGAFPYAQFYVVPALHDAKSAAESSAGASSAALTAALQTSEDLKAAVAASRDPAVTAATQRALAQIDAIAVILCAVDDAARQQVCEQHGIPTGGG